MKNLFLKAFALGVSMFLTVQVFAEETAYTVPTITEKITVDANSDGTEAIWASVPKMTCFTLPWEKETPPATTLQMCHDAEYLYFLYEVVDPQIVIEGNPDVELDVAKGDRVEIFFASPDPKGTYYCFEMGPNGRVLDYTAKIYRKFDYNWHEDWLKSAAVRTQDGYRVEGAFKLADLRRLNLLQKDGTLGVGFFRAEYRRAPNGEIEEHWISWKHSGTKEADFHVWGAFGTVKLQ